MKFSLTLFLKAVFLQHLYSAHEITFYLQQLNNWTLYIKLQPYIVSRIFSIVSNTTWLLCQPYVDMLPANDQSSVTTYLRHEYVSK